MMIWIFHMFVYGFGKYTVFIEVSCIFILFRVQLYLVN